MIPHLVALLLACGAPTEAPAPSAAPAAPADEGSTVAARLAGAEITLAEVDAKAGSALVQARQQIYDARRAALDELVADKLVEAEAGRRAMERDALLQAEVDAKIPPVDEAKILELYEANKPRLGEATLDEVRPRIVDFLSQQAKGERYRAFVEELKTAAQATILLDPPRTAVTVPDDAARWGSPSAPVQIVEWSDFECPYCSKGAATLTQIKEAYGDKVSIVYRHFPLDFHPNANKAAQASACAQEQGKFWEYHDKLFENQRALGEAELQTYARDLGLEGGTFSDCLSSGKYAGRVAADLAAGQAVGVTGTPGFFVNGRFLGGALPFEAFSEIIDDELAR